MNPTKVARPTAPLLRSDPDAVRVHSHLSHCLTSPPRAWRAAISYRPYSIEEKQAALDRTLCRHRLLILRDGALLDGQL
jgi:hypothetical protein